MRKAQKGRIQPSLNAEHFNPPLNRFLPSGRYGGTTVSPDGFLCSSWVVFLSQKCIVRHRLWRHVNLPSWVSLFVSQYSKGALGAFNNHERDITLDRHRMGEWSNGPHSRKGRFWWIFAWMMPLKSILHCFWTY